MMSDGFCVHLGVIITVKLARRRRSDNNERDRLMSFCEAIRDSLM